MLQATEVASMTWTPQVSEEFDRSALRIAEGMAGWLYQTSNKVTKDQNNSIASKHSYSL